MEAGGRSTDTEQPRSIWRRSSSGLLSDCQGQFHLSLTFPLLFTFTTHKHGLNKPFKSLSNCLCLCQSTRSCFLHHAIFPPSLQTDFPLCIYLFSSVTRDINISVGFGWHLLSTQWRDTIPTPPLTHVNTTAGRIQDVVSLPLQLTTVSQFV